MNISTPVGVSNPKTLENRHVPSGLFGKTRASDRLPMAFMPVRGFDETWPGLSAEATGTEPYAVEWCARMAYDIKDFHAALDYAMKRAKVTRSSVPFRRAYEWLADRCERLGGVLQIGQIDASLPAGRRAVALRSWGLALLSTYRDLPATHLDGLSQTDINKILYTIARLNVAH